MIRKRENKLQLIVLVIMTMFALLFIDLIIYGIVMYKSAPSLYYPKVNIMENLLFEDGKYKLSDEAVDSLGKSGEFAMLLDNSGNILWSEGLPVELEKKYTIQDVARFTRYYLNDYPVHTYVVEPGLLVVGYINKNIWKYTLEYYEDTLSLSIKLTPFLILGNIVLLIIISLRLYKRQIRQKEEERVEWIAGVSHDIRTPLAIILGNAGMIMGESKDYEVKKRAEVIEKQGIRCRTLVENLNFLNKLDYGSVKFEKKNIQMSTLLRKSVTQILNALEEDVFNIELDIDEPLQKECFLINEDLIERAIINLLNNSIKHNKKGCNIQIKLYRNEKNAIVLRVEDNGVGASKELLKKLNKKGYEMEKSEGNHGLGLKIVKQVASRHKWKIFFKEGERGGFVCEMILKKWGIV